MSRVLAAVVVTVAVVAAACSSGTDDAGPPPAPTPTATSAPAPTVSPTPPTPTPVPPTATPVPTTPPTPTVPPPPPPDPVQWVSCGGAVECASVPVPIDYADPAGPSLDLAVARVPARDGTVRIGSLFVNPGGPGGSGIDFLRGFADSLPPAVTARFDLVSWDPRGVGASSGLDCNDDVAEDIDHLPTTSDGIEDDLEYYVADVTALGQSCLRQAPELLATIGTVSTARDLDLLRQAVGDPSLTYLGYSYGSRVGAVYATLFPETVRAMILDGAFPPGLTSAELASNAADFEETLRRIDATCDLEASCPVREPGLDETVVRLLGELDPEPGTATLGLSERGALVGALLLAIYAPSTWDLFAAALGDAAAGNLELTERMATAWFGADDGGFSDIYNGANTAIMCADQAYPTDRPTALADAETAIEAAPTLAALVFGATCEGWPVEGDPLPPVDTEGAPPILVVGGTHDPATPLRWAARLADQADGVLLTFVGDGHTIVGRGNRCIDGWAEVYLVDLTIPPADTLCRDPTGSLGLRVSTETGGVRVDAVTEGSPAAEAAISAGDLIIAVDGVPTTDVDQLVTSAGQSVMLTITRDDTSRTVSVTADRQPWTLPD